jgi:hypothetical protein
VTGPLLICVNSKPFVLCRKDKSDLPKHTTSKKQKIQMDSENKTVSEDINGQSESAKKIERKDVSSHSASIKKSVSEDPSGQSVGTKEIANKESAGHCGVRVDSFHCNRARPDHNQKEFYKEASKKRKETFTDGLPPRKKRKIVESKTSDIVNILDSSDVRDDCVNEAIIIDASPASPRRLPEDECILQENTDKGLQENRTEASGENVTKATRENMTKATPGNQIETSQENLNDTSQENLNSSSKEGGISHPAVLTKRQKKREKMKKKKEKNAQKQVHTGTPCTSTSVPYQ